MKLVLPFIAAALLFAGCCTSCPPPHAQRAEPTSSQVELPTASKEFDGSKSYLANPTTLGVWQVDLPETTNIGEVQSITLWVSTTGVEGRRKGDNVFCDKIQIVSDEKAHALIASHYIFLKEIQDSPVDISKITAGQASGSGDVFTLKKSDGIRFKLLRANLGAGKLFIKLVSNQPERRFLEVTGVKVLATDH